MNLTLPVPIFLANRVTKCEIIKPSVGVLMDTKKIVDRGDYFSALKKFLSSTVIFEDNTEKTLRLIGELPIQSAEYLTIQIMLLEYPDDDGIEGVYICPRCGTQKISECRDDIDNRDFISDLEITYFEEKDNPEITKDVNVNIIDKKTDNPLFTVTSITMRHPKLNDYIEAVNKVGFIEDIEIQKFIYLKCITKINNEENIKDVKNKYGQKIIYKLSNKELNYFASEINKYGMNTKVEKNCLSCGKKWETTINTSNFFVGALQ